MDATKITRMTRSAFGVPFWNAERKDRDENVRRKDSIRMREGKLEINQ